jgi:hypothetical protein
MTKLPPPSLLVPALGALLFCSFAGCGPSAADREKLLAGRSPLFATLARESNAGPLKARFDQRFPDLRFEVSAKHPTVKQPPKGRKKFEADVSLVVINAPPNYSEIQPLILRELEYYLVDSLEASGMELNGSIEPTIQKSKKVGFWFNYKAKRHSGALRVDFQEYVSGGTLISIVEEE